MKDIDFFSSNTYIYLPTKQNPKVALVVNSSELATNAFKLYNPFSSKAKKFKRVIEFCFDNLNVLFKNFAKKKTKSEFIVYLEKELNESLVSSLYFATAKDKVVLQLQSKEAKILGYLKYPLNEMGLKHIKNEIRAYDILSSLGIVEGYLLSKEYLGKPFLFLKELNGSIGNIEHNHIEIILEKFKRDDRFLLSSHPRITQIKDLLQKNGMQKYFLMIEKICKNSIKEYRLVYEHGDFAPWNIVKVENDYIPFDFEYFVEDGLEYLDSVKYYYQVGKLLDGKNGTELLNFIKQNLPIDEINYFILLFLIKEILIQIEENSDYEFEEKLLDLVWEKI